MTGSGLSPERMLRAAAGLWAAGLVLALSPMTLDPAGPPKMLATGAFAALAALAWAWNGRGRQSAGPGFTALVWAWFFWQAVCALASDFPANSLFALREPLAWALVATGAALCVRWPAHFWRWAAALLAALCLSSLYGIAQRFGWDPFPWGMRDVAEYRLSPATFANPNVAGHALALGLVIAGALCARSALALPAAVLLFAHLWLTGMRGGMLAVAAAGVMALAFWDAGRIGRFHGRRVAGALAIFILIGAMGAGVVAARTHARQGLWLPGDGSMVLRYNGWHGAARMLADNPATGVGPGNYALENAAYWTDFERRWFSLRGMKNGHAHNEPLEAAAETGLPGLALFLALLAWPLAAGLAFADRGPTREHRKMGLTAALVAVAAGVDGLFGFNLHTPAAAGIFFFVGGALDGIMREAARDAVEVPSSGHGGWRRTARLAVAFPVAAVVLWAGVLQYRAESRLLWTQGLLEWLNTPGAPRHPADPELLGARRQLEASSAAFPWEARFPDALGRLLLATGDHAGAAAAFETAFTRAPHDPVVLSLLGRALAGEAEQWHAAKRSGAGQVLKRALSAARRAERLCPMLAAPQEALWRVAALQAEMAETADPPQRPWNELAWTSSRKALQYGAAPAMEHHKTRARAALALKMPKDAVQAVEQGLNMDPSDMALWELLERALPEPETNPVVFAMARNAYVRLKPAATRFPDALVAAAGVMVRSCGKAPYPSPADRIVREVFRLLPDHPGARNLAVTAGFNLEEETILEETAP